MRILASIKPLTVSLPKPPYDGFFECSSFECGGKVENLAQTGHFIEMR